MDENTLITLIGSVGFPIVACMWFMNVGKKTMDKMTEAMQNLTIAMNKVIDKEKEKENEEK